MRGSRIPLWWRADAHIDEYAQSDVTVDLNGVRVYAASRNKKFIKSSWR